MARGLKRFAGVIRLLGGIRVWVYRLGSYPERFKAGLRDLGRGSGRRCISTIEATAAGMGSLGALWRAPQDDETQVTGLRGLGVFLEESWASLTGRGSLPYVQSPLRSLGLASS